MNKQNEALKMAIGLCEKSIKGLEGDENSGLCSVNDEGVFGDALREYYKLLQACKEALAEAEKQEPYVVWLLEEGKLYMTAVRASELGDSDEQTK